MYKNTKTGELISLEDAESAAFLANMSLDGWLNFYNFVEEGKEQDPAQPPMMGPQPVGGDSSSEDGSSALPLPSSYLIETGQLKSKRDQRAEQSRAIYEQEQMAAFDPLALDPRMQRPEAQEATAVEVDVIPDYAGLGLPTIQEQIEFDIEERDLNADDVQGTNLFLNPSIYNPETGEFERANELVKKYYSSETASEDGFFVESIKGESTFDDKVFSEKLYAELKEKGINVDNFEGFLKRDPIAKEYLERIERGDFKFDESFVGGSLFDIFEAKTGLGQKEEKAVIEQMILRDLLERYVEEVNDKANRQAFLKDFNANPEKYQDFINVDDAYQSYVYNNGYGEVIGDVSEFTDKQFADVKAFEDEQTKKFLQKITDEDGAVVGRNSADAAESFVRDLGINAFRGIAQDPWITINSMLGFKGEAAKLRDKKRLSEMRLSHLNKGAYLQPPAGKRLEVEGVEYLLGDDGLLYNLTTELVANSYMDPKEVFAISEKVKSDGYESTYNPTSYKGGAV